MDEPKPKKPRKQAALTLVERKTLDQLLEAMNEEYSVIQRGSQVLVMRHWIGEDGLSKLVFMNRQNFLFLMENKIFYRDGEKPIKIGEAWISWQKRKNYEEVYFEPQGKDYPSRYNLWRGFNIPAKQHPRKQFGQGWQLFNEHIAKNICQNDEAQYTWLMSWLADMFQNPANKPGTAVIMRGGMGVGKGQFASHIGHLLGLHYMSITQPSQLTGKFNGHMMDKLLMFIDESWWDDNRTGAGVLNALVTEKHIALEMKGRDVIFIPNYTRFIMASNADWVMQTGLNQERRYAFFDVGNGNQQDKAYFAAIQQEMDNGGYEAMLYDLLHMEYDKHLPRTIPKTEALADNNLYSMPDELKWWHGCLIDGCIGDFNLTNTIPANNDMLASDFYEHYRDGCAKMLLKPLSSNVLPKRLNKVIDFGKKLKPTVNGNKPFYCLKALDGLRADFEAFLGAKYEW